MKDLQFPLLTANDIDLRVGQKSKDGTKACLLLYKDARVDMALLDKIVGWNNWQREHKEIKGVCYCGVSIWDEDKKQWITKWDAGKESNTEAEKGEASDSFKRACVNATGVGRELYTAPKDIWVATSSPFDKWFVKSIGYNENREINHLVIVNDKGVVVYELGKKIAQPKAEPKDYKSLVEAFYITLSAERQQKFNDMLGNEFSCGSVGQLDQKTAESVYTKYINRG